MYNFSANFSGVEGIKGRFQDFVEYKLADFNLSILDVY